MFFYKILLSTIVLFFLYFFSMNVYIFSRQIARKITRPLDKLATGFEEIASGKYDKRLNYETYFELMQIQHLFNVMSEKTR